MSLRSPHARFVSRAYARAHARLAAVVVAALVAGAPLVVAPGAGATVGARLTIGRAPAVPAGARAIGWLPSADALHVTVALAPIDPQVLAAYARGVSTPGSPVYRRYLTVAQFAARFAPAPSRVASLRAALRAEGLTVGSVSPSGLALSVAGSAAHVSRAFATAFRRYRLRDGRVAFANTSAPAVPALAAGLVQGVVGLDSLEIHRPAGVTRAAIAPAGRLASHAVASSGVGGSGSSSVQAPGEGKACGRALRSGGYTAGQIGSAYDFGGLYASGDGGAGQTIALFELEPYSASDLAAYERCYGNSANVSNVNVDGGSGTGSGQGEAALDVEDLVGLAPQANVLVYQGPNTGQGAFDTYAAIVNQDRAKVVSTSWGSCENPAFMSSLQAENTLFQEAAAQGQTVLAASGDNGVQDCGAGSTGAAVDDPASQPYVTGVGGTSLSAVGPPVTETAWDSNWGASSGAGGGGVSSIWGVPAYQAPFVVSQASTTCGNAGYACREVPDVSADADINTGYAIIYQGAWFVFGGTSAATPTWAALMALGDATSACRAHPIGFANAALYAAARSAYAADFNDVTSGDNSFGGVTGFSAGPGYDMASGLGSPKGSALMSAMCGFTAPVTTPGHIRITVAGTRPTRIGDPLRVAAHARDSARNPVTFSATGLPAGLSISAGGLVSGAPEQAGRFAAVITATDTGGGTASAPLVLTVIGRPMVSHRLGRGARGRRRLTVRATAGYDAAGLRRLIITGVPGQIRFTGGHTALARYITATGAHGRRLNLRVSRRGNTLVAILRGAASRQITLYVTSPVLSVGATVQASVATADGRAGGLRITASS